VLGSDKRCPSSSQVGVNPRRLTESSRGLRPPLGGCDPWAAKARLGAARKGGPTYRRQLAVAATAGSERSGSCSGIHTIAEVDGRYAARTTPVNSRLGDRGLTHMPCGRMRVGRWAEVAKPRHQWRPSPSFTLSASQECSPVWDSSVEGASDLEGRDVGASRAEKILGSPSRRRRELATIMGRDRRCQRSDCSARISVDKTRCGWPANKTFLGGGHKRPYGRTRSQLASAAPDCGVARGRRCRSRLSDATAEAHVPTPAQACWPKDAGGSGGRRSVSSELGN
jgi:hypothetical protein